MPAALPAARARAPRRKAAATSAATTASVAESSGSVACAWLPTSAKISAATDSHNAVATAMPRQPSHDRRAMPGRIAAARASGAQKL